MKKYFDIFNDIIFNGVLTGLVKLEILEDARVMERFGSEVQGFCQTVHAGWDRDPRFKLEKPYSHIIIAALDSKEESATEKIQRFIETLPHEMFHAVFDLFTCYCESGCVEKILWGPHQVHWQAAAKAIEKFMAKDIFMSLSVSWDREIDMAWDTHCGYDLPNAAVLRTLGLDITAVLRRLDKNRKNSRAAKTICEHGLSWGGNCTKTLWVIDFP